MIFSPCSPTVIASFLTISHRQAALCAKSNELSLFQAIDLEPIDFEHFIDEPDLDRPHMEKMFRQDKA